MYTETIMVYLGHTDLNKQRVRVEQTIHFIQIHILLQKQYNFHFSKKKTARHRRLTYMKKCHKLV